MNIAEDFDSIKLFFSIASLITHSNHYSFCIVIIVRFGFSTIKFVANGISSFFENSFCSTICKSYFAILHEEYEV